MIYYSLRKLFHQLIMLSMPFNEISNTIKKHIYIICSEKFVGDNSTNFIERYVAKHPLLRPEFIVVNDEIHGFKRMSKKVSSLEQFPIYLEVEGIIDDSIHYIESIDLYSEADISCQKRLTDIIYLSKLYENYIQLDRIINVSNPKSEKLVIISKVQEFLINITEDSIMQTIEDHFSPLINGDESSEELVKKLELSSVIDKLENSTTLSLDNDDENSDEEDDKDDVTLFEALIDIKQFNILLTQHLTYFVHFIKLLDDILVKNIPMSIIEKSNDIFPKTNKES
jgi:hypothetical protein